MVKNSFIKFVKVSALSVFLAGSFTAQEAFANSLTVPGSHDNSLGIDSINSGVSFYIGMYMEANRSYACTYTGNTVTTNGFSNLLDATLTTIAPLNKIGTITPVVYNTNSANATLRASFTLNGAVGQTDNYFYWPFENSTSSTLSGRFECAETTLYGGYNTNVNNFNFLEINNITNSTVTGTITATNFDGAVVINKQPFSIAANRRFDVDVHSAAGANKYGSIRVTHTGPYGALQSVVSQYAGTASNFTLQGVVPLKPRDNNF